MIKKYNGKFIQVMEEDIEGAIYEKVFIQDSLTIFPFNSKGELLLIKEKRVHESPPISWKCVTGFYEHEYDLEGNANRELQEEIGKKAGTITPFFDIRQSGTFNTHQHFVIATDLTDSKIPNPDGEDTIIEVKAVGLDEVFTRTINGELSRGAAGYGILRLIHEIKVKSIKIPGLNFNSD